MAKSERAFYNAQPRHLRFQRKVARVLCVIPLLFLVLGLAKYWSPSKYNGVSTSRSSYNLFSREANWTEISDAAVCICVST